MDENSEIIIALFKEFINELKEKLDEEEIKRDDIYTIIRNYEKRLKFITSPSKNKKPDLILNFGESYIIDEEKPNKCYDIFNQALKKGRAGLCITRTHPESISFYGSSENVKFIWLTTVNYRDGKVTSLQPTDLSLISNGINNFIKEGTKGIILMDGIELLIKNNGFDNTIKSLTSIKDNVKINKGIMIISINLKKMGDEERNFLLKEFNLISLPSH